MTDTNGFIVYGEPEEAREVRALPDQGHEVRRLQAKAFSNGQLKQMLGFLGSVLLFLGVFMPIVSAPIIGSLNYLQNGRGDGVIILVFAILSLADAHPELQAALAYGPWVPGDPVIHVHKFPGAAFSASHGVGPGIGGQPFQGSG